MSLLPTPFPPAWAVAFGVDACCALPYANVLCGDDVVMDLRWTPPGTFKIGSPADEPGRRPKERLCHPVTLSRGFWLGVIAVTRAQWQAVMGTDPSRFKDAPDLPVEQVSWGDCQTFCTRLNECNPGLAACLPTEAQWEYACRAGTQTPFSFGHTIDPEQVNYDGNYPYPGGRKGPYRERTVRTGSLPPNSWGLYEMHGNVWEWCQNDKRVHDSGSAIDFEGLGDIASDYILRGGCCLSHASSCRSAFRWPDPGRRDIPLGFRCAAVQPG